MSRLWKLFLTAYYVFFHGNVANARRLGVTVGTGCRIYTTKFGTEPFLITIGDRVTITSGVRLITHDGSTILVRDQHGQRYQHYAPISIGNDVFVGVNSIVLPGVSIGSKVIVAAGSVVASDIPDNTVVAGVPAKPIGEFSNYADRVRAEFASESDLGGFENYEQKVAAAIEIEARKKSG